jgi:hypothetical protein
MKNKIETFAALVQTETIGRLQADGLGCQSNLDNAKTKVVSGQKYTKVNVGTSGRFMVENSTGNIFGIKGYGQVHKGHFYGTVDTINDYFWGGYYPIHKSNPAGCCKWSVPKLTFAPEPVVPA